MPNHNTLTERTLTHGAMCYCGTVRAVGTNHNAAHSEDTC